jgi:hypothetical protein
MVAVVRLEWNLEPGLFVQLAQGVEDEPALAHLL